YTLAVSNAGPSSAVGVTVTDTLPAGVSGAAAAGAGWVCVTAAAGTITCARPSLDPGSAPAITLTATAPLAAATLVNAASVVSSTVDPNHANDAATEQTIVQVPVPQADLSLTESDTEDPVGAAEAVGWIL